MRKIWLTIPLALGIFVAVVLLDWSPEISLPLGSKSASSGTIAEVDKAIGNASLTERTDTYYTKPLAPALSISAKSYLVDDLDTGETILAKSEKEIRPIASVSKLMTALLTEEYLPEDAVATVSKKALATEGGNGDLRVGEKIKVSDLVYPLLMQSSNDAAEVIAEWIGRENFLAKMNERAKELLMFSTSYQDPTGLSPSNRSSPSDLLQLTKYIYGKRPELLTLTTKRSYGNGLHLWPSNNQFLRHEGYLGGKSGFTDEARQTVVSLFSAKLLEGGPRNVGIALLGSTDRKRDVESILKYLNKNVAYGVKPAPKIVAEVPKIIEDVIVAPIPEAVDPDYVTLTFAGDIMMSRGVRSSVLKNFGGDYSLLFDKLDILKNSDIVFANLEGTASDKGMDLRNLYSFRMDPQVLPALKGGGISVLSVANNHIGDYGREAFTDTLARLKENEILYTGGGLNKAESERPVVIEKYGIKIGFLGFSDKGPQFMRATDTSPGILLATDSRMSEIIKSASRNVDYLIVSFHFGEEYQSTHDAKQSELAHMAIDNGAKIVIGHHPHVIQETEVYDGGFIAYSVGNFIFDQNFSTATMQGLLLEMKLYRDGAMTAKKNTVKLSPYFQPNQIIPGKEEKVIPSP